MKIEDKVQFYTLYIESFQIPSSPLQKTPIKDNIPSRERDEQIDRLFVLTKLVLQVFFFFNETNQSNRSKVQKLTSFELINEKDIQIVPFSEEPPPP